MITRLKLILTVALILVYGTPAQAFKVDGALSAMPPVQGRQNEIQELLFQATARDQTRQSTLGYQRRASDLFLMFNLPTVDLKQTLAGRRASANFYFNLFGPDVGGNAPVGDPGKLNSWVECEGCRSIFELGYEEFLGCGKRLFFGWC